MIKLPPWENEVKGRLANTANRQEVIGVFIQRDFHVLKNKILLYEKCISFVIHFTKSKLHETKIHENTLYQTIILSDGRHFKQDVKKVASYIVEAIFSISSTVA